jgi:hypothetical protein
MTVFNLTVVLEDAYGRATRKNYETEDISGVDVGAEFLTARGFAATLMTALGNFSEARILSWDLGERVVYTDTVDAGANVDEGATIVIRKVNNKKAILKVPAPVNSVFNPDGTIDITDAIVTAYEAHFRVTGGFTLSDGENSTEILSGRLDK